MIEMQVIVTWFTPEEKLPPDEKMVIVTFTGRDGSISYDHTLGVGTWYDNDNSWCKSGWIIEGLSDSAEYVIHAWCDLECYRG